MEERDIKSKKIRKRTYIKSKKNKSQNSKLNFSKSRLKSLHTQSKIKSRSVYLENFYKKS